MIFNKLFGSKKNDSIDFILENHPRANKYRKVHLQCYLDMLDNIQSHEKELMQEKEILQLMEKIAIYMNENLSVVNEANVKFRLELGYDTKIAGKILDGVLQYIHDQGYVKTYLHFMAMHTLLYTYGVKYNQGADCVVINGKELASKIIPSIFDNVNLFYDLANKSYIAYRSVINNAAQNGLTIEEIEIDNSLEDLYLSIIYWLTQEMNISKAQMKEYVMKGIDNIVIKLGSSKIDEGIEHILFDLIKRLGFDGGLNQIPSFNTIALSQAKRDVINDDYLPSIDINLSKNEKFLYDTEAIYRKLKNETQYSGVFYGLTTSIKIVKGVRFRAGVIKIPKQKIEKLEDIDFGILYLTNKRVLFKGKKKTFSINLNKLLSVDISEYGLLLFKDGNENPYIVGLNDESYYVFGELVSDLLNKE